MTYAKQDADREDEIAGPGLGVVTFTTAPEPSCVESLPAGSLNAPWGLSACADRLR